MSQDIQPITSNQSTAKKNFAPTNQERNNNNNLEDLASDSLQRRLANLKPFTGKPPKSGTRKDSFSLVAKLRSYLLQHPVDVEKIIISWVQYAQKGSFPHLQSMVERFDGKVPDRLESNEKLTIELICYTPQLQGTKPKEILVGSGQPPVDNPACLLVDNSDNELTP